MRGVSLDGIGSYSLNRSDASLGKRFPVAMNLNSAMFSRKQELGRLGPRRSSPTNSSELDAAFAVMNEENMTKACMLLLSERDYDKTKQDGESDMTQLKTLYTKYEKAYKTIQQKADDTPLLLPHLSQAAPPPGTRIQQAAKPLKAHQHNKSMGQLRRGSMVQLARGGAAGGSRGDSPSVARSKPGVGSSGRPGLKREPSDSSLASISSNASGRGGLNKKQRVQSNSDLPSSSSVGGKKSKAPPPEALSFLQALNSQPKEGSSAQPGRALRGLAGKKVQPKRSSRRSS